MSDSSMHSRVGLVVGTAGHVDHGKTSLVYALTGIDTDRFAEEKRRGISIDLGFAHMVLPGGEAISFVDVPGHERFVKNMLAGVGGIGAALLVVAADESVKPQTREHFDICRLLQLKQGLVALTKVDIANPEQIAAARAEIVALCAGSFLAGKPIIPVSAQTGQGLPELKSELHSLVSRFEHPNSSGLTRLPIDRSFTLKGFGTVVTGTLWSGSLRRGDIVELQPTKQQVRVRGLQVHGDPVETASAGERTAVNLAGIEANEIRRGFVLTDRVGLEPTSFLEVAIDWLPDVEIPHRRVDLLFHVGTAEALASLKILSAGNDERSALARLWLSDEVLTFPGDRFILRRPSPQQTVAGGTIIEIFPSRRASRMRATQRLTQLMRADPGTRVEMLVAEAPHGQRLQNLVRSTGQSPEQIKQWIAANPRLTFTDATQHVVTREWIDRRRVQMMRWLSDFHKKNPSAQGAPLAQVRGDLDASLMPSIFDGFAGIRTHGDLVSLANHEVSVTAEEARALSFIETTFLNAGYEPPGPAGVLQAAGTDSKTGRRLLETLIKSNKLIRLSDDLVFHSNVVLHVSKALAVHKGRRFSVPEFKAWTNISRKYAIPLLEYLDRQHVTRREGDVRIIL